MLNFASFARSNGARQANYLYVGSFWGEELPRLLAEAERARLILGAAQGDMDPALEAFVAEERARVAAEIDRLTGRMTIPADDPDARIAEIDRLVRLQEVLHDYDEIFERAWHRLLAAIQMTELAALGDSFPVRLREDTSPEMRELLGLSDDFPGEKELRNLLTTRTADGRHIPGKHYNKANNGEPTAFFALIFSPDKSVSVRDAFGTDEERAAIRAAHNKAVDEVMRGVEADIGWVRTRVGGEVKRERGEITWIRFLHETSRENDPQLHSHAIAPNTVRGLESGRVGSLDTWRIHGRFMEHRRTYHAVLARELLASGFDAYLDDDPKCPRAVIRGLAPEAREDFSKRSQRILAQSREWAAKKGVEFDRLPRKVRNSVMQSGVYFTRPDKDRGAANRATWLQRWLKVSNDLGWSRDAGVTGGGSHQRAGTHSPEPGEFSQEAWGSPSPATTAGPGHDWGMER